MLEKIKSFLVNIFCKSQSTTEPQPIIEEPRPQTANSHRKEDHSAEQELAQFLDKFLYDRFPTGSAFSTIRRTQDKSEQLDGVDVEFVGTDGRVYCVDEKAQLHYLNQNLPTFAFELLSYQKGFDTVGWLCNDQLKTDFYMLVWPFATQNSYERILWNDFTKADCLLVQKKRLLKLFNEKGLTVERMKTDARVIRRNGQRGKIPIPGIRGIYYFASYPRDYKEAPINIVVSKEILTKIAQRRYIVTPEEIILK